MIRPVPTLDSTYLVPNATWLVELLTLLVVAFPLLVVVPLVRALRSGAVVWVLAIVLLAPFGGLAWWLDVLWNRLVRRTSTA